MKKLRKTEVELSEHVVRIFKRDKEFGKVMMPLIKAISRKMKADTMSPLNTVIGIVLDDAKKKLNRDAIFNLMVAASLIESRSEE